MWTNFLNQENCQEYFDYYFKKPIQLLLHDDDNNKNELAPTHFKCKICHSNLIHIKVRQVRKGDEGQTTFCECSKCNYKWTIN